MSYPGEKEMRLRWPVLATALVLLVSACGGGSGNSNNNSLGGGATTTVKSPSNCNTTLKSTDVGVSPTTITVTVLADVQNGFRPGLFKGSWNGVKAWSDFVNSQGGLACRKVVVKQVDSKLSPTDAANGVAAACTNSMALVGTTALFLQDVTKMNTCKDKAGKATGLPDVAVLQTEANQQCSPVSFATLPSGSECPYSGTGPRVYRVGWTQYDYYLNKFKGTPLHGVFAIPKDTPSTIASSMPIFRAENRMGIKSDVEFGMSGTAIQTDYTQLAQALKSHKSNYARNGLDYKGTVLMRKEAQVQGVDTVKVWDCSVQCYDKRLIQEGGAAVEGQYVWLNFLPFEDRGHNADLDGFLKYDKDPDGFGAQAFIAGEIFAQAVNDTVKAHNGDPNSLTRANLLTAIRNIHDFDANGMAAPGIDIGNKRGSTCLVGLQVQNGKFVRIDPTEPGTFDCDKDASGKPKPAMQLTIDAAAEYHG
jgi:ABC-type branched-subunit amino acid transport system substrate-binding protein